MSPRCRVCRAVVFESGVALCVSCASRRRVKLIAGGIALGVTAVLGVALVIISATRTSEADGPSTAAPGVISGVAITGGGSQHHETIDDVAIRKCDAQQIVRSAQNRIGARREREALELAQRFTAMCGRNKSLDIERFQAHESLEQWAMAETIASSLSAESPTDRTYWAFRGRAHLGREKFDAALAELRQAYAVPDTYNTGFLADYVVRAAERAGEPCEGAHALRWFSTRGGARARNHSDKMLRIFREHGCIQLDGQGTLSWTTDDATAKGSIAGEHVRVRIDPKLGTTLVSRSLAARAKLEAGKPLEVLGPSGLVTGAASKADVAVGAASALQVPVVIVEELDVDAVIGTSFLWRFHVEPGDRESVATSFRARYRLPE